MCQRTELHRFLEIRHGFNFVLMNVALNITKQPIISDVFRRRVLASIGYNKRMMLEDAWSRDREDIVIVENACCKGSSTSSTNMISALFKFCVLQDTEDHRKRCLEDPDVYMDFEDDSKNNIKKKLHFLVNKAGRAGLTSAWVQSLRKSLQKCSVRLRMILENNGPEKVHKITLDPCTMRRGECKKLSLWKSLCKHIY